MHLHMEYRDKVGCIVRTSNVTTSIRLAVIGAWFPVDLPPIEVVVLKTVMFGVCFPLPLLLCTCCA
jgi:hypothetical protein